MSNIADYFNRTTYKSRYEIGDRVIGKYDGTIPFIGSVGNDTRLNEQDGPYVTVHLDLPLRDPKAGTIRYVLSVKHKSIKSLKEL